MTRVSSAREWAPRNVEANSDGRDALAACLGTLPSLCEDETLQSFIARWFRLGSLRNPQRFLHACLGANVRRKIGVSTFGTPGAALRVAKAFSSYDVSTASTIRPETVTLAPYYLYGQSELFHEIGDAPMKVANLEALVATGRWASILSRGSNPVGCLECIRSDIEMFGFSWFRRAHQVPIAKKCYVHGAPLVSGCATCGSWGQEKTAALMIPTLDCRCSTFETAMGELVARMSNDPDVVIAGVASDLLHDPDPLPFETVKLVIRAKIAERYDRFGAHAIPQLAFDLHESFDHYLTRKATGKLPTTTHWLKGSLLKAKGRLLTDRYTVLIAHLFGSVDAMRASAASNDVRLLGEIWKPTWYRKLDTPKGNRSLPRRLESANPRDTVLASRETVERLCFAMIMAKLSRVHQQKIVEMRALYANGHKLARIRTIGRIKRSCLMKYLLSIGGATEARRLSLQKARINRCRLTLERQLKDDRVSILIVRKTRSFHLLQKDDAAWVARLVASIHTNDVDTVMPIL